MAWIAFFLMSKISISVYLSTADILERSTLKKNLVEPCGGIINGLSIGCVKRGTEYRILNLEYCLSLEHKKSNKTKPAGY